MDTKTVYVPVPITERLPKKQNSYSVLLKGNKTIKSVHFSGSRFDMSSEVTHWLEKQEMVVMSLVDYEEKIKRAREAGGQATSSIAYYHSLED